VRGAAELEASGIEVAREEVAILAGMDVKQTDGAGGLTPRTVS